MYGFRARKEINICRVLYASKSLPHSLAKPIVSTVPAWRKKVVVSHFSTEPTGPERLSNLHRVIQCGCGEMNPEEAQEVQKEGRSGYGASADGVGRAEPRVIWQVCQTRS